MKTAENRKHAAAIAAACIALAALVVLGTVIISYWNTPIAKTESRTMQAMLLQEDGSAEPCTVLISGISYHYLFRNHADSFEANDPGGVFVNGSRIMDSLILPSDIDSDWMFWQDDMLWCDAAGEQLIVLLHRDADGAFAETGTPVLVIAPAETEQEAQARQWGHSTFGQSAALAAQAGAKRLWLTHYSPMITDPEEYAEQAQGIFPAAECGFDGKSITLQYEEVQP